MRPPKTFQKSQVLDPCWTLELRCPPQLSQNLWAHFSFSKSVLASPTRLRGLGKGATSPPSPERRSNSPARSHRCSQKTLSLRIGHRPNSQPQSVARILPETDSPVPNANAADCNTAR